jgi:O-antigen/teichoic acid export membrane protein
MLNQQRICAAIYATAFSVNAGLCVALAPTYGGTGAAFATSVAIVIESALLFVVAKRRLGLHSFFWGGKI